MSIALLGVLSLVVLAGWGHWRFLLWTPDVAREQALESKYHGLLSLLRDYIQLIPSEGASVVEQALRADATVKEWGNRPEVIAVTLRAEKESQEDLYIDGAPPELLDSEWLPVHALGQPGLTHGRKYSGAIRYEFVEYSEVVKAGEAEYRIELILDLLQLQGLLGVTFWGSNGNSTDPK